MWSKKWKEILIWVSGFFGFLTFALVGGYTIVKSEDEDLKKTAKKGFIVLLIFTAVSAFFSLFNAIAGMSDSYYGSSAYKFYTVMTNLVTIAKIVVYAVFVVLTLIKKDEEQQ